ncbi:DUF2017 domain-containing protein [Janibacter cremeus]|uniref:Uncharacterized protein (DUF885 family) n=1 Tax=Janibacter cremeus TaxID=1285192 RepID=A0A852VTC8_9MICO|nr:DUF2017 domain-containing protein [Janibacter cremeus]NYF99188.1 uncharacterized protein (DUF885 family) [Janibacter cremeus]
MARAFRPEGDRLVAVLDEHERSVVAGLCTQVAALVEPTSRAKGESTDPFDAIVAGLGDLLTDTVTDSGEVPDRAFGSLEDRDPALDRLFPTGNREDEQEAAEFRRFTEQGLRSRKHANLMTTVRTLDEAVDDEWVLTRGQAPAVMIALTDVRLVMGERLGLRTDEDAERLEEVAADLEPDDPAVFALSVYDFLTWLQESLTGALTSDAGPGGDA